MPRIWHHDYLHLRPLARDLQVRIREQAGRQELSRVLDLGCGYGPYSLYFSGLAREIIGMDMDPEVRPGVVGRGEAVPFADESFDAVISSQVIPVVDDPAQVGREIARVLRPGGRAWVSGHGTWPNSTPRPEHRFGLPDLPRLFADLDIIEIVPQGGMMGFPFALFNIVCREFGRAAERRLGGVAKVLQLGILPLTVLSNLTGRLVEILATRTPLRSFLGYLHHALPLNYLVVVEKPR